MHNFSHYAKNSAEDNQELTRKRIAQNGLHINVSLEKREQVLDMNTAAKAYSMRWGSSSTSKHGLDTTTVTSAASIDNALHNVGSFLLLIMVALVISSNRD